MCSGIFSASCWCSAEQGALVALGALGLTLLSLSLAAMDNLQERALHVRKVLLNLPKSTLIVMRYLFAFLNQ